MQSDRTEPIFRSRPCQKNRTELYQAVNSDYENRPNRTEIRNIKQTKPNFSGFGFKPKKHNFFINIIKKEGGILCAYYMFYAD